MFSEIFLKIDKNDVSREADELFIRILKEARERMVLAGKDPLRMVTAALYVACKVGEERMTQKDVVKAADTTEVTLRNRLRDPRELVDRNRTIQLDNRVYLLIF